MREVKPADDGEHISRCGRYQETVQGRVEQDGLGILGIAILLGMRSHGFQTGRLQRKCWRTLREDEYGGFQCCVLAQGLGQKPCANRWRESRVWESVQTEWAR